MKSKLFPTILAAFLAPSLAAQINIGPGLAYTWPAAGAQITAPQQLDLYLIMNPYGPRITSSTLSWTVSGTAPSACTFNLQGSPNGFANWTNLDGGSAISCTSTSSETITGNLPNYIRIYFATFTQGDSTTRVTFAYAGTAGTAGGFAASGDLSGSNTVQKVIGLDGVPFCTGFTPTSGQAIQYTTSSSPNPCYTAAAGSGTGTVTASAQYDVPYYTQSGTMAQVGGAAIAGLQYDSTSAPPAAATAAQIVSAIGATAVTNATNATNATNVATTTESGNMTYYMVLAPANSTTNQGLVTVAVTYNPSTGLFTLPAGASIVTTPDGTHPAQLSLYPNTTVPTLSSGDFSILGPNAASVTQFAWQAPTAYNSSAGILHIGAGSSAGGGEVSQMTISPVVGSDMANNTVTATQLAAQYSKGSCTEVFSGSGTSSALTSGDDAISNNTCYNDSGVTRTITAVKCRSDNGSNTTTVNPTFGSAGTGTTILSGAITCGSSYAYSSSGTVSNGSWTTGTGIDPAMGGTLTGTSIAMIVEYTF